VLALGLIGCALAATNGCSFHSLEYLGAGGNVSGTGGDERAGRANANGGGSGAGAAGLSAGAGAAGVGPDLAHCDDSLKNGDETDLDCGGRICGPCLDGKTCAMGTDCQSAICTNTVCQPPSCTDLALNGDETDLNCGGSCAPCAQGRSCSTDDDCSTANCTAKLCESGTCLDGVLRAGCPLLVDNTPYSLSPAKGLGNCIDDDQDSVSDGNALLLRACQDELRQTFWAIERTDGYFAFRSALSGKCLHVRGASTTGGAIIEQSTCGMADDQQWKPSLVDSSVMSLTSRSSSLSLNVAADNASHDGQAIIQGQTDNRPDTAWRVTRRTTASYVTFSPDGERGVRIRHIGGAVALGADDQTSAQWIVVPGLGDPALVSFQSRNDPGRYLRHASFRLWSDTNDGSAVFKQDATFRYGQPFVDSEGIAKALESSNYPGQYWKRDGEKISLSRLMNTTEDQVNATWHLSGR